MWVEARDTSRHPAMHRSENYPAPNISRAEVKEAWSSISASRFPSVIPKTEGYFMTIVWMVWSPIGGQCHFRTSSVPINTHNSVPHKKWWNKNGHVDIYTLNDPIITLACLWFKTSTPRNLGYGKDTECWKQKECRRRLVPPAGLLSSWVSLGIVTDLPGPVGYICKMGIIDV